MILWILSALAVVPLIMLRGLHQIPEGHIGIYFRGGAMLEGFDEPGWHYMMPLITTVEAV